MILQNIESLKVVERVICKCDECGTDFFRTIKNIKKSRKNNKNKDFCISCAAKSSIQKKPQCQKEYWVDKKQKHGEKIKKSDAYKEGIKNRKCSGKYNSMFGKKHKSISKQKMSNSRKGKTGEKANAWKGGKLSFNKRLKRLIAIRYDWYKKIYQRDKCTCQNCGKSKCILDAHHIKPISKIIKELLLRAPQFKDESEKIEWFILQPEIVDENLKNGITLCRDCHKKAHKNWGSHNSLTN